MNNTKKILFVAFLLLVNTMVPAVFGGGTVFADHTYSHCDSQYPQGNGGYDACIAGVDALADADAAPVTEVDARGDLSRDQCRRDTLDKDNCVILFYLINGINFLSAAAGLVFVFSMMWAGYQYMTARDNSGQIQQARTRIIWTIVAMVIFVFMYSMLNFLIPGGVLP